MGATAPIFLIRFQSLADPFGHPLFFFKLWIASWQFLKKIDHAVEDF